MTRGYNWERGCWTNTRKEEKLLGTSTEDTIRKSSQATFVLSTDDPGRPRRRWLHGFIFEDRTR
jgi:hypothetical protein